jgi:hypothetical protein
VSIAQQIATPTPSPRTRRPSAPLQAAPTPHPGSTLARIFGLVVLTAIGTALMAGSIAIGMMIVASNLGG